MTKVAIMGYGVVGSGLIELIDKNITLEVNEKNPAVKFYKKIGFEIVSIRKGYYNGQDGYLMEKKLEVK